MTTANLVPTSYAASYLAFECCLCTTMDRHDMVRTVPKYAAAHLCLDCNHTVCHKHWMPCQRCSACCWETCTERHWEKP